jgi:hypothetical protein
VGALVHARIQTQGRLEQELREAAAGLYRGGAALKCSWGAGPISTLVASIDTDPVRAAAPLSALLNHAYCRFLESVKLDAVPPRDHSASTESQSLDWVVDAIARSACAVTLKLVAITADDSSASIDASPLATALPRLTSVTLAATDVQLHGHFEALETIDLHGKSVSISGTFPSARSLTIPPLRAPAGNWQRATFPALEELTLDARSVQGTSIDQLSLEAPVPAAADLTIQDASERLVDEFFRKPFPAELRKLRLPGMLGRAPQVLLRNVDRLKQLAELDLRANSRIGDISGLKTALGSRLHVDRS